MFKLRNILFVLVALAIVLVSGCGDDSDSAVIVGEGPPLSKREFVKEANRICLREDARGERSLISYKQETSLDEKAPEKFNAYVVHEEMVPLVERQIARISELVPPEADREQVEEFLVSTQEAVDVVAGKDRIPSLFEADPAFKEPSELARKYGIWRCAIR